MIDNGQPFNASIGQFNFLVSLQAITKFGLASSLPVNNDETTFSEIAKKSTLPEVHVRRILRHAMAFRIFQEPRRGVVRHTAASKALADTPLLRQYIGMVTEELWPAATKVSLINIKVKRKLE